MINFLLLVSRQGKVRLTKWYAPLKQKEKVRVMREVSTLVLNRPSKMCNFVEWRDQKIVYRKYASLFFVAGVDPSDNELMTLEMIHHFVEVLDRYFGNVCELDIIFNFHKAFHILDELMVGGELQEVNRREVLRAVTTADDLTEHAKDPTAGARAAASAAIGAAGMDGFSAAATARMPMGRTGKG